jgi:hypothetical protein
MAKTITIIPVSGCIRYKGIDYLPTNSFACDATEAQRLIAMGVAKVATFGAQVQPPPPSKTTEQPALNAAAAKTKLLDAIAAAVTQVELMALLPEEEPEADIKAAFTKRLAELEEAE